MVDLMAAFEMAVLVHGRQRDHGGEPYMGHICRVMSQMESDEERVVAILHDVLEDSVDRALNLPLHHSIAAIYGPEIYNSVLELTYDHEETYMEYIANITRPLAVKVKLADLADNLRDDRLEKLPLDERVRLRNKYLEAYRFLKPEIPAKDDMHE